MYPSWTAASDLAAQTVVDAMADAGLGGQRYATSVAVVTHQDGSVTVGFSGNSEKVQRIIDRLQGHLPDKYTFAPTEVDTSQFRPVIERVDGTVVPATDNQCAEPKLFAAARENPSPIEGMTVMWRGNRDNPHPHPERGGNYMEPCASCQANIDLIRGD